MSNLTKGLILLLVVLGIGAGLVIWKNRVGGGHTSAGFNKISKEEIEMLLADVAKVNPMVLKRFAEDPEMKKQQLENMKELLAYASESQREGLTDQPNNRQELKNIRAEVVAVNYDRETHKDAGPMPPFGFITEDQINAFWGEGDQAPKGFWASLKNKIGLGPASRELEFQKFLDTKVALLKASNPQMKDREISDEERKQAREIFAKIGIYEDEYENKVASGELSQEFQDKVNLQVKLQQAQFLARIYSEKLAEKVKVSDEDIAKYIAEHPELDTAPKRAKAQEVLDRAKRGEDFAELANQYSEDPGNTDPQTQQKKGGLYADTPKGRMVPEFEKAALSLQPGEIYQDLVETDYGFHIIKLEKLGQGKDPSGQPADTYDVRHILISTGYKDPSNPMGRDMPVKQFVRTKLEDEKEKKAIEDLVAQNHVEVPEDFDVPEVSDEQIKELMQKQQMPQGMDPDGAGVPPPPPAAKGKDDKGKAADTKKK